MRVEQKIEQNFVDAAVAARHDSGQEPWWWWTVIGGGKLPSIRWISGGGGNGDNGNDNFCSTFSLDKWQTNVRNGKT